MFKITDILSSHCAVHVNHKLLIVIRYLIMSVMLFVVTEGSASCAAYLDDSTVLPARVARLGKGVNISGWFQYNGANKPVNDQELKLLKAEGFTAVRLPVDPLIISDKLSRLDELNKSLGILDDAIDLIINNNLAVVLDLHDMLHGGMLYQEQGVEKFIAIWKLLAERYKTRSAEYLFYELMNEPFGDFKEGINKKGMSWVDVENQVIGEIRKLDSRRTIIVTGVNWSRWQALIRMKLVADNNVIYSIHYYDPVVFTHQGTTWLKAMPWLSAITDLRYPSNMNIDILELWSGRNEVGKYLGEKWDASRIESDFSMVGDWAKRNKIYLWLGEFGVYSGKAPGGTRPAVPEESRYKWIEHVRKAAELNGIGWCMWDYKGNFGLRFVKNGVISCNQSINDALGLKGCR